MLVVSIVLLFCHSWQRRALIAFSVLHTGPIENEWLPCLCRAIACLGFPHVSNLARRACNHSPTLPTLQTNNRADLRGTARSPSHALTCTDDDE